jgi:hypothetical protein
MMHIQASSDQFGGGHYLSGQGQGVNQDRSWLAMFQIQSFPGPWYQIPQLTTSPIYASHTRAPSLTSASHVENVQPTTASHAGVITLVATRLIDVTSSTYIHHVADESLAFSSHVESMSPVIVNDVGGIEKPRRLRRKPKFLCRT